MLRAAVLLCLLALLPAAGAELRLPAVIGENMVLQRGKALPIWGWAQPGEAVTVTLGAQKLIALAGRSGRWQVTLAPMRASAQPLTLRITGDRSETPQVLKNVLVGEVWLCSGQSNMAWSVLASRDGRQEAAGARHPGIRLLSVARAPAGQPQERTSAAWQACTPRVAGRFSAVAYYFGRALHRRLGVPIGLIDSSWGGTRIEPWTPLAGLVAVPELEGLARQALRAEADFQRQVLHRLDRIAAWVAAAREARAAGKAAPAAPLMPEHRLASHRQPTGLYNGMVHPLVPFAIRGAIWYQGESNLRDGMAYLPKMKGLILGWRKVWGQGAFPFYYVQLAPYRYRARADLLPRIWEAQTAALALPGTGMVVTTDVGNPRDIHPRNKQAVGGRLALWALARTYGQAGVVHSGPRYVRMTVEQGKVRLHFEHVGGGLESRDGKPLDWFSVAGADRKFHPARAVIVGETIVVSSPRVPTPVAVRFGWHQLASPNLRNKAGLPAAPFRTDRW